MRPGASERSGSSVWATAGAAGCSVFVFIVILGVVAFLTRDNVVEGQVTPVSTASTDAGRAPELMSVTDEMLLAAATVLKPALHRCFVDALARDPSAGRKAKLNLRVLLQHDPPRIEALTVVAAPSPFFRPCLAQALALGPVQDEGPRDRLLWAEFSERRVRFSLP